MSRHLTTFRVKSTQLSKRGPPVKRLQGISIKSRQPLIHEDAFKNFSNFDIFRDLHPLTHFLPKFSIHKIGYLSNISFPPSSPLYAFPSKNCNLSSTALLCASNSSTFASCITAPPTFLIPSSLSLLLVICFWNEARLTPEYCFA